MNQIFKKFDNIISLGYNCYVKMYLKSERINCETHFFDYTGSSVWSIIDLLNNNFSGISDPETYKIIKFMDKGPNEYVVLHPTYFIRFKHQFKKSLSENVIDHQELSEFIETMKRRKDRFLNKFTNDESILFIRYEEDLTDRCYFSENTDTKSSIITLANILKNINTNKKIYIISLSFEYDKTEYLREYGVIKIKMKRRIDDWLKATQMIREALYNERNNIDAFLN